MDNVAISDDALKLLVAEHGVRGTARLLDMDERATDAFRQRVTRGKWLADPHIAARRAVSPNVQVGRPALPVVATMSPQAALNAELASLGQETRLSLAKGISKAGKHIAEMKAELIVADAGNVKSIAQTADLVHGWKDSAPQVKIRLDVLSTQSEQPVFEVESECVSSWESEGSTDPDNY